MSEIRAITIMGRELRVRSDEPAEHLQALARYVDERIAHVAGPKKADGPDPHLLLITTLQLADEIFKLKAQQAEISAKLRSSSRSLLGRIEGSPGRASGRSASGQLGHAGETGEALSFSTSKA